MRKQPACSSGPYLPKAELHVALNSERGNAKGRQRCVLFCHACGLAKAIQSPEETQSNCCRHGSLFTCPTWTLGGCFVRFSEFTIVQLWSPPTLELLFFNLHQVFLQFFDLYRAVLCYFGWSGKAQQDFIGKLKKVSRIFGFKAISRTVLLNFWVAPGSEPSCRRHPMVHYCLLLVNSGRWFVFF